MGKNNMEGQLDIFSFIGNGEPPILLSPGQKIYKVRIGEIEEYVVSEEEGYTYTYGDNGRGYYLNDIEGYGHGNAWNDSLGKSDFIDLEPALKTACENRIQWQTENNGQGVIYIQSIIGYRRFRHKCNNGRYLYSEIGFLQSDLIYVKKWYCYRHVYPIKSGLYEKYLKEIVDYPNFINEEMEVDINYSPPCRWYTSKATGDVPMGITMYWDTSMKCYREARNMYFM